MLGEKAKRHVPGQQLGRVFRREEEEMNAGRYNIPFEEYLALEIGSQQPTPRSKETRQPL